jgi:hypothetical protein
VWKEASIKGSMTLALLAEAAVAMARFEARGRKAAEAKPSELSIVRSLRRSTVTRFRRGKAAEKPVFSSWEAISAEVVGNMASRLSNAPGTLKTQAQLSRSSTLMPERALSGGGGRGVLMSGQAKNRTAAQSIPLR